MKHPYPKGKGKVHPSPPPSSTSSGDVLRLLPAAIFILTAALGEKDKEVLAYLIARSMKCQVAQDEEIVVSSHPPTIGCGCFECYTSFWSRWDSSPDREIIHQAIEAFEEHLLKIEKEKKEPRKKKNRRGKDKVPEKVPEKVLESSSEVSVPPEMEVVSVPSPERESEILFEEETIDKVLEPEGAINGGSERKKSWADVMGIFNFRLWGT